MEHLMKKFFRSSMITSMILAILGFLLIFQSEATIISISYIIGGILIAIGALAIVKFLKNINNISKDGLDIVYGIVTIILGIIVIRNPEGIASIIPIVLGISIIISSATKLQYSFELKANNNKLWKTTMVISLISTLCGIVLLFNPFKGAVMFTKVVGTFIVIYSVLDMISTFTIKRNVTLIHEAIEEKIIDAEVIDEENDESEKKHKKKAKKVRKNKKQEEE